MSLGQNSGATDAVDFGSEFQATFLAESQQRMAASRFVQSNCVGVPVRERRLPMCGYTYAAMCGANVRELTPEPSQRKACLHVV